MLQNSVKVISSEKKQNVCSSHELGKRFIIWFFVTIMVKNEFVVLCPFPAVVNC